MGRLLYSSKFWTAVATAAAAVLAAWGLPQEKVTAVVAAITALGGLVIAATGYEDAAKKGAPPPPDHPFAVKQ